MFMSVEQKEMQQIRRKEFHYFEYSFVFEGFGYEVENYQLKESTVGSGSLDEDKRGEMEKWKQRAWQDLEKELEQEKLGIQSKKGLEGQDTTLDQMELF